MVNPLKTGPIRLLTCMKKEITKVHELHSLYSMHKERGHLQLRFSEYFKMNYHLKVVADQ